MFQDASVVTIIPPYEGNALRLTMVNLITHLFH